MQQIQRSTFIVLPVYNEAAVIAQVIEEIKNSGAYQVIVVDDGSDDNSYDIAAALEGIISLRHKINRGKGAAVKTGVTAAHRLGAECVVTMDGDGQHNPREIGNLIEPILNGHCDVVLGTRLKQHIGMPFIKVIANKIGNVITLLFYGIYVSDSQSGFRAYSRYAASIIDTKADKYEYDSRVIREIRSNRLTFIEVPIEVRYTDYSKGKAQKQGFVNGIKTIIRMIWDIIA